jgi:AcrR family transcriptional regulator
MNDTPPPPIGRQNRSAVTRQRLLQAAAEAFIECGYERTTVADIARRASVTVGALYGNYRSKAEILLEVIRSRLKLQSDSIEAHVRLAPNVNQAFIALSNQNQGPDRVETRALLLETFAVARRDPAFRQVLAELLTRLTGFMTSRVKAAQEAGLIDKSLHAPTVAWLYLIPAAGEAFTEAAGLELPPTEAWLEVVKRITHAVAPDAASSREELVQP